MPGLLGANPAVLLGALPEGAQAVAGEHAAIHPDLPSIANTGYLLDGVFHPGDAFLPPPGPVSVLLLPVGGPWLKLSEAVDYLRTVEPELVIPIHQGGLAPAHQTLHHQLIHTLAPRLTDVAVLEHGATYTL